MESALRLSGAGGGQAPCWSLLTPQGAGGRGPGMNEPAPRGLPRYHPSCYSLRVAVPTPPPLCVCWGGGLGRVGVGRHCFLWRLAGAEPSLSEVFCPARWPRSFPLTIGWRFWLLQPHGWIYEAQRPPVSFLGSQGLLPTFQNLLMYVFYRLTSTGKYAPSTFSTAEVWPPPHLIGI